VLARIKSIINNLSYLFLWLIFAILITLTLFQVHATVVSVALAVVQTPSVRPMGWNTGTIYGLSRLLWLVLGIFWLGWVMFTDEYLREGRNRQLLLKRSSLLLLIAGVIYGACYLILLVVG
jgi:hypothetical protein